MVTSRVPPVITATGIKSTVELDCINCAPAACLLGLNLVEPMSPIRKVFFGFLVIAPILLLRTFKSAAARYSSFWTISSTLPYLKEHWICENVETNQNCIEKKTLFTYFTSNFYQWWSGHKFFCSMLPAACRDSLKMQHFQSTPQFVQQVWRTIKVNTTPYFHRCYSDSLC